MSLFTTEIPTRLGYIGLVDHADIYGKDCYPEITEHTVLTNRTYKVRTAGTWCISVYFKDSKIHSLEINSYYYEKTPLYIKAVEILKNGPLTKEELFKKLKI